MDFTQLWEPEFGAGLAARWPQCWEYSRRNSRGSASPPTAGSASPAGTARPTAKWELMCAATPSVAKTSSVLRALAAASARRSAHAAYSVWKTAQRKAATTAGSSWRWSPLGCHRSSKPRHAANAMFAKGMIPNRAGSCPCLLKHLYLSHTLSLSSLCPLCVSVVLPLLRF